MNTKRLCHNCGVELTPGDARGLCPRCLLQAGLGTQTQSTVNTGEEKSKSRPLPQVGEQFGRYHIIRRLGHGGMGVVYEAEESDTGRRVALKVLGQSLNSPEDRARFLREGRLAASINHPNCVYVYGTEEIENTPTIAMELVPGGTLQERVTRHGPMPVSAAVDAILQITSGLEAAQAIGILHRDIKPGNCFEDSDGTIKIGDFGLSISTAARAETNLTAAGVMIGTPSFCSPEQLRGEELNARSDMYAVGVTLYYLLTGRVPFEGKNMAQLIANALEKSPPSPRSLRLEIPRGLAAVVLRCLKKQPSDRFKDYEELRRALLPYSSVATTPATLGLRLVAGMLDHVVLGLLGFLIFSLVFGDMSNLFANANERPGRLFVLMIGGMTIGVLYYTVLEGIWGVTLGKLACKLRVVTVDKNPPGLGRALIRAVLYLLLPPLPFWLLSGGDPFAAYRHGSPVSSQLLMQLPYYLILGLLFSTVRRRNGFAAVHDLLTRTRVTLRTAEESRPAIGVADAVVPDTQLTASIGPYQILEIMEKSADEEWLVGYDLRLLRKVWIHVVPPGTPSLPAPARNVGRAGRLRWLTGRRSPDENWDAFENLSGQPLLKLIRFRQPWKQVRFWLYDLGREVCAAEKDGTLPLLALDRVWITSDGHAKLLDVAAPGLGTVKSNHAPDVISTPPVLYRSIDFLNTVASAGLSGSGDPGQPAGEVRFPLPLHARAFLESLTQLANVEAAVGALRPLLRRVAVVSRLRRAVVIAGCLALPVLGGTGAIFGFSMLKQWNRTNPDVMQLSTLLNGMKKPWVRESSLPDDRLIAIYIANHYRGLITNQTRWSNGVALMIITGEARQFAERSVAEHPASSEQEIKEADEALKKIVQGSDPSNLPLSPKFFAMIIPAMLAIYVGVPALIAALAFRGGLVLFATGIGFVRRDGLRASRLRVFWRAIVSWGGLLALSLISLLMKNWLGVTGAAVSGAVAVSILTIISVWLPERGLPDRLSGTWPVPR